MVLPNFLVIGAYKSGTSSIHRYLAQHPDVFMSRTKEPEFFALDGLTPAEQQRVRTHPDKIGDLATYCALFANVRDETVIGESSPKYLTSAHAAERIRTRIPHVRLVACLRQPIEALYSNYNMHLRRGRRMQSFSDVCRQFERQLEASENDGLHYAVQLKRYYERFPSNQIRVYLYEDLATDAVGMMQDMYRFLGVDDAFVPKIVRRNFGRTPRHPELNRLLSNKTIESVVGRRLLRAIRRRNMTWPDPVPRSEAKRLSALLRDDIVTLQNLIDRDLSRWLQ